MASISHRDLSGERSTLSGGAPATPPVIGAIRLNPPAGLPESGEPAAGQPQAKGHQAVPAAIGAVLPTILLADDNDDDTTLIQSALFRARLPYRLKAVTDGEQAVRYLEGEGLFADRVQNPFPVLLLLDLRMPRRDGFEVLDWLKRTSNLTRLVVVVLSGSSQKSDMDRAFQLGANSYLVKTESYSDLISLLKSFDFSR